MKATTRSLCFEVVIICTYCDNSHNDNNQGSPWYHSSTGNCFFTDVCVFCSKIFCFWQFGFLPLCCCLTVMTQCYHCCACFGWTGLFKRSFWVLKVEMPKTFSWTPVVAKKIFQSYTRLLKTQLKIIKLFCVFIKFLTYLMDLLI